MDGERLEFHDVGLTDGGKCHHRSNQSSFCRDSFNARASNLNGSQIMSHFLGRSVEEYGIEHLQGVDLITVLVVARFLLVPVRLKQAG